MGKRIATIILSAVILLSNSAAYAAHPPKRILFVGNSITYTNNLPSVFVTLVESDGKYDAPTVDMFVKGGARLSDLSRDTRLLSTISTGGYDAVVLQEQGGKVLCASEDFYDTVSADCNDSFEAHLILSESASSAGASVHYLGTYQPNPKASRIMVGIEQELSKRMNADYIEISETLRRLQEQYPDLAWFHKDKMHPGHALTVLMAGRVYDSLYGHAPSAECICVSTNLFNPQERLNGLIRSEYLLTTVMPSDCIVTEDEGQALNITDD